MSIFISLLLVILLTFSYKIVDLTFRMLIGRALYQKIEHAMIYIWGTLITIIAFFYVDNFVFRLPIHYEPIIPLILITAITFMFTSRHSGYHPIGKKNILNFVIMYPIFEEVIFRGMMIPILNNSLPTYSVLELFHTPVTLPILLSAFLFAIAHLQYYSLNRTSVKFMLFAFLGGILLGMIANDSLSIVFALFLHIEFNLLAVYYSKKFSKKGKSIS
ncbi:CPBP family intramembrane glutamic endopeptidase [Alkalicoccobacillus murimartini]|uniref:Membrane protease YdiL (CAAX protease family) n=1 Tax=Alkalicoccobacillus murimartini TaxID=171685 RepID=A0ABT9YNS7_9BACI|nr:CPBP family intramembrane glutamic endopeptidase [Alkalicoccobacillus murimartini]MDQ0208679.1 membrane protease YdiL (CAAX protease family) [Alkalicoccobacillus murimartini]